MNYVYNADGLRVRQTLTPTSGTPRTTWYLQDSGYAYAQVIEERQAVGTEASRLTATFTFADDLVSQTRYAADGTPTTHFIQADGFGSTRWLTDDTGAITDLIDYDAFGNEIRRSGSVGVKHLYRRERFDADAAMYDLRARLFSPSNGRFLTQDPFTGLMAEPKSLHKYAYAEADPVSYYDPTGNLAFSWSAAPMMMTSTVGRAVLMTAAKPLLKRIAVAAAIGAAGVVAHYTTRDEEKKGVPMFLVGSNHPDIRAHVQDAQSQGIRPIVNRRSSPHSRDWLHTNLVAGKCGPGLTGGTTGKDCDEYPMAIHTQGGKSNFIARQVSVAPASLNQNRSVGSLVRAFHAACDIKVDSTSLADAYIFGTTDEPTHFTCGDSQ